MSDVYWSPGARKWRGTPSPDVRAFHASLPGYAPTHLKEAPDLAQELGVRRVFVKEESERFGLPAFKILGASFAIARALSQRLGFEQTQDFDTLRIRLAASGPIVIMTATDGNHGRAVATVASMLGLPSKVWFPSDITTTAKRGIVEAGAEPVELAAEHSELVRLAAEAAEALGERALLVQDTAWPGYERVPGWIVDGYSTMFRELDGQLLDAGVERLDLVSVPTGVGSLTHAAVRHARAPGSILGHPVALSVEPETASVVKVSLQAGTPTAIHTSPTIMTGLNCGAVSTSAWPSLQDGLDAAVAVGDEDARAAVTDLHALGVDAGPSGAASLAGVRKLLQHPPARAELGRDAVLVLLSTEGQAANPLG